MLTFLGVLWVVLSLGVVANLHREHDDLGRHGGHFVGEAVSVDAVHAGREGVAAIRLPLPLVDCLALGTIDLDVNVQEPSLSHLEGQTYG